MSAVLQYNDINVLKQDLETLPEKMLEWGEEVLLDQAYLVLGIAQILVAVKTGTLRDTGRIERGGKGKRWRTLRVRFGGYRINPDSGKLVDYAVLIEKGTNKMAARPFLTPAYKMVKDEIAVSIAQNIKEKSGH